MKYPKLVIDEATKLIAYATDVEKAKLDFECLDPESKSSCIYGQMTGNCNSTRAIDLIVNCTEKVYVRTIKAVSIDERVYEKTVLNGKPVASERVGQNIWFSPIEIFISRSNHTGNVEANKKLIQFIKGEIKSL